MTWGLEKMAYFDPVSEEAEMLRASAERFVSEHYLAEKRRARLTGPVEARPAHWPAFAELGWLGAPYAEDDGGLGLALVDIAPMMEAFGAGLVLEPYIPAVLHCGTFLGIALDRAWRKAAVAPLIEGQRLDILAAPPAAASTDEPLRADSKTARWRISGTLSVLPGGAWADGFWVPAETPSGLALFRVEASDADRRALRLIDGTVAASVRFEDAPAEPVDLVVDLEQALDDASAIRLAAACADAVGAMDRMLRETVDYVGAREQFGKQLGKFQVVQHALADLLVALEEARSMAELAAHVAVEHERPRRNALLAAARLKVGESARAVAHGGIQFHGGMGVSDEVEASHLAKRLLAFDTLYGRRDAHLATFQAAA